jgi:hypothetical protein
MKEKSAEALGTTIEMILVATNSSGPGTTTRHPKKSSIDHATSTTPMSMEREFETI